MDRQHATSRCALPARVPAHERTQGKLHVAQRGLALRRVATGVARRRRRASTTRALAAAQAALLQRARPQAVHQPTPLPSVAPGTHTGRRDDGLAHIELRARAVPRLLARRRMAQGTAARLVPTPLPAVVRSQRHMPGQLPALRRGAAGLMAAAGLPQVSQAVRGLPAHQRQRGGGRCGARHATAAALGARAPG